MNSQQHNKGYIGRFAPSPTGELHFGSLVSALASYLDARAHRGKWLVRMEDIDPPRAQPDADRQILLALEAHALHWDDSVLFQSTRTSAYQEAIDFLLDGDLAYYCSCSRLQLKGYPIYPGFCNNKSLNAETEAAIRIRVKPETISFDDRIQGRQCEQMAEQVGDFVVLRKDGLFAYQLAVAIDDAYQKITHVIRGYDLLDSTSRQIYIQQTLDLNSPGYCHVPVLVNKDGQKLSKQNQAQPLDLARCGNNLYRALQALNQQPPADLDNLSPREVLNWAIPNWDIGKIPKSDALLHIF